MFSTPHDQEWWQFGDDDFDVAKKWQILAMASLPVKEPRAISKTMVYLFRNFWLVD